MTACYRIRPGNRVKDLPLDAQIAFSKIPGGQPSVDFAGGTFWSLDWRDGESTRIPRKPGDWLVEAEDYGISIVDAAEIASPDGA
ncbi:hypothetical protein OCH239_09180 [Roseivivax halodurans JCM 10272]|uniref:Uncharacterized protein n=1 Tax=Roseivivax halodurans JCM 10272 TaxID=1449350 RepID=X7EEK3_9RHOB|nr:hypothetical protein [Roseivivax halodurans]ETX13646.1 hypothetical protein OCH239_09180 [Roseivivax halodurans JCM 10272]